MDSVRLEELLKAFSNARVLVVGDIYLDENVSGTMTGISLEAPVPIYEVRERRYNPGAAGNAACNVAALGGRTWIAGVVGNDTNAGIVRAEFEARGVNVSGIVVDPDRPTNTYGKLRAGGVNIPDQEILRTDTPTPGFVSGDVEQELVRQIARITAEVDAIVVVDQVGSVVSENVLMAVVACAGKHKLLTVGDSRSRVGAFNAFDVLVPNDHEAGLGAGFEIKDDESLRAAGHALRKVAKNALITRGADGISVFAQVGESHAPAMCRGEVVDVTGAGDTVTAAVTLTMLAGGSVHEAAAIGNAAAGVAVTRKGATTVTREEVLAAFSNAAPASGVVAASELDRIVDAAKQAGRSVVWTNGCFDILHAGHVTYLRQAAAEGDVLIVGLNADASVRAVKGPDRPIVPEGERALIIAALKGVDYVTVFDGESPAPILKRIKPDVYAKGGDYTIDTIDQEERRIIEGYGGRIALISGVDGRSTTNLVERLAREYEG